MGPGVSGLAGFDADDRKFAAGPVRLWSSGSPVTYTLPVLYALEGPDGRRIRALLQREGPVTDDEVDEVIGLVREGGYVQRVLDECRRRLAGAAHATAALPDIEARAVFRRMGEFLVDRVGSVRAG